MKRLFIITLLLMYFGTPKGQSNKASNLHLTIDSLHQAAQSDMHDNIQNAILSAERAVELSSFSDEKLLLKSYANLGKIYRVDKDYPNALEFYLKALKLAKKHDLTAEIAKFSYQIGRVYTAQEKYQIAIKYILDSRKLFEELEDHKSLLVVYGQLAECYKMNGDYLKGINYAKEGLELAKTSNNHSQAAVFLLRSSNMFIEIDALKIAESYAKEALELFMLHDSNDINIARSYNTIALISILEGGYEIASKALEQAKEIEDLPLNLEAHIFNNEGKIFEGLGKIDEAIELFRLSRQLFEEAGDQYHSLILNNNLGKIYFNNGEYHKALNSFKEGLSADKTSFNRRDNYFGVASSYYFLNELDSAWHYAELYDTLRIKREEMATETLQFEVLEQENKKLKAEQEKDKMRLQGVTIISVLIALLLVAVILVSRIRNRKKMAEKDTELFKQKAQDALKNLELKSNYARLEGQEIERKKIAKTLHDQVCAELSTLKIYFESIQHKLGDIEEKNQQKFNRAFKLLDNLYDEVRGISHNMTNHSLKQQGLVLQVKELISIIKESEVLKVDLQIKGLTKRIGNYQLEEKIYAILQELITNTLKHANASELKVVLEELEGDKLRMLVEDDGRGLPLVANENAGIGLATVEARVHDLEGKMMINSQNLKGTSILIDQISLN